MLNLELVLEHDEITLTLLELHLLLESGTKGVERVTAGGNLLVREETDPAKATQDTLLILRGVKCGLGDNSLLKVGSAGRLGTNNDLGGLVPGNGLRESLLSGVVKEANLDQDPDELRESLVSESTSDDGLSLGDVVALLVGGRVSVRVGDEGEAGVDEVGLGGAHQVLGGNIGDLAVLVVSGGVSQGEEDTAGRPGELVSERVARDLGGGETTAVAEERQNLSALGVDLLDRLDGVQVVNYTR